MTGKPRNLSSDCITRAKITMPAPSPYSLLSSSDSRCGMASSSQTLSRRPVQSLGGRRCGFSNNRKVYVPSSGSPGVVYVGIGTGEVVGEVATASRVGARVIGEVHGKDQGTTLLVPSFQSTSRKYTSSISSSPVLISPYHYTYRSEPRLSTIQYRELY